MIASHYARLSLLSLFLSLSDSARQHFEESRLQMRPGDNYLSAFCPESMSVV
jgi:hypothetical protein